MSEADNDQPEAFCNFCGNRLELLEVNAINPYPYRCTGCGRTPSSIDGPPHPPNLAESYAVNLGPKKRDTL